MQYRNGLAVGNTVLTGAALANIASVAEMDEADLAAIEDAAELAAAVGTYEGEDTLAEDLAATVDNVAGLLPAATFTIAIDSTDAYTYTATPTAAATVAIGETKTKASIAPGGSTSHNMAFTLPTVNVTPMFYVAYDKGTHAGTLTIGGEVVTGSGKLYFFWTGEAYETYSAGEITVTVPDQVVKVTVTLTSNDNTLILALPTGPTNVSNPLVLDVAITADGGTKTKIDVVLSDSLTVSDAANGKYILFCAEEGVWIYVEQSSQIDGLLTDVAALETKTTYLATKAITAHAASVTIPDLTAYVTLIYTSSNAATQVVTLPTGAVNVGHTIYVKVAITGTDDVDLVIGGGQGNIETLQNCVMAFDCIAAGHWMSRLAMYGPAGEGV
jgi:hypothetical protein